MESKETMCNNASLPAREIDAGKSAHPSSHATNNSNYLSPFDLSGLGMGFGLYRPRRPSYSFATKSSRQHGGNHVEIEDCSTDPPSADGDVIEEALRNRTRKISYIKAMKSSEEDESESLDTSTHCSTGNRLGVGTDPIVFCDNPRVEKETELCDAKSSNDQSYVEVKIAVNNHIHLANNEDKSICNCHSKSNHRSADFCLKVKPYHNKDCMLEKSQSNRSLRRSKLPRSTSVTNIVSMFTFHKNLIILCVSFILVFSSYQAIQNVQSSINQEGYLGILTMTIAHISMIFSCLIAPIIINICTAKWGLCIGINCFIIWFGANFRPTYLTLVPTSLFVGLGKAILWSAENSYLYKLAYESSRVKGTSIEEQMSRFHGIFIAFFQTTHIWGNLISSILLSRRSEELSVQALKAQEALMSLYVNQSMMYPDYDMSAHAVMPVNHCGALHRCGQVVRMFPNVSNIKGRRFVLGI